MEHAVKWVLLVLLPALSQADYMGNYHCEGGRDVMVHLFEWKWADIAQECEQFLSAAGYCAVQVSPPSEHRIIPNPGGGDRPYPWYQRYQPVSYLMDSRSGTEAQFRDMVTRCNDVGVRIYVDAVINHMTGGGSGIGSSGSSWAAGGLNGGQSFPAVPYGDPDFHRQDVCPTPDMGIHDYNSAQQVRYCWLLGLRDLRMNLAWVRDRITDFLNKLVDWGVAGYRVDAAKHMLPADMEAIFDRLHNLPSKWFPTGTRPFIFQEVISMHGSSEPIKAEDYVHIGRVTEFNQGRYLAEVFQKQNGQYLKNLRTFGTGWGLLPGLSAVTFIDNHDNQRGHGGGGTILTFKNSHLYKMATAFELAWNYGYSRVMSSYDFDHHSQGPPSDSNGNTHDASCFDGDWICEHRWRQIANMVKFHNAVAWENVNNWWDNDFHAIAFSRGSKGFIVINNESSSINRVFSTGLPDGQYCDVITCVQHRPVDGDCGSASGSCRGPFTVTSGLVALNVPSDANPYIALHV